MTPSEQFLCRIPDLLRLLVRDWRDVRRGVAFKNDTLVQMICRMGKEAENCCGRAWQGDSLRGCMIRL